MPRFVWSEEYSVGIRLIDNDHRGLFDAMNDLTDAIERHGSAAEVAHTIHYLVQYVKEHFQREEGLMRDYGYPEFEEHKQKHRKLSRQVHAIQKLHDASPELVDLTKLVEFLRGWLMRHILGSDMDYAPYLKGDMVPEPAPAEEAETEAAENGMPQLARLTLQVPPDRAEVLVRCAEILRAGGSTADDLEDFASPLAAMTLDDAKKIAEFVLA